MKAGRTTEAARSAVPKKSGQSAPGSGLAEEESEPARFLVEATVRFAQNEEMVAALEEYTGQFSEGEEVD